MVLATHATRCLNGMALGVVHSRHSGIATVVLEKGTSFTVRESDIRDDHSALIVSDKADIVRVLPYNIGYEGVPVWVPLSLVRRLPATA